MSDQVCASKFAVMAARIAELEQQQKQWEPRWWNATDYEMVKAVIDGEPVNVGEKSECVLALRVLAMRARIAELEQQLASVTAMKDAAVAQLDALHVSVASLEEQGDAMRGVPKTGVPDGGK